MSRNHVRVHTDFGSGITYWPIQRESKRNNVNRTKTLAFHCFPQARHTLDNQGPPGSKSRGSWKREPQHESQPLGWTLVLVGGPGQGVQ